MLDSIRKTLRKAGRRWRAYRLTAKLDRETCPIEKIHLQFRIAELNRQP